MQFARVNPRDDLALNMTIKPPVKANGRTKPPHLPKSLPPDPEDLRRRLYIVLSEQNAQREARRLRAYNADDGASFDPSRAGSSAAGDVNASLTSVYTRKSANSFAARAEAPTAGTTCPGLRVVIAPPRADASFRDQDLRRADSKMDTATTARDVKRIKSSTKTKKSATTETAHDDQPPAEPYHHVPQVAAQQFARTATAKPSLPDMSNIHPLSRQALKFHIEGSATERTELESSKTPGEQNRALRRAQSTREKLQGRNQFQDEAHPTGAAAIAAAMPAARNKRHSLPADGFAVSAGGGAMLSSSPDGRNHHTNHNWNWANMGDIVEDTPLHTNGDDCHYNYQTGEFSPAHNQASNSSSYHQRQRSLSFADLLPGGRPGPAVDVHGEPLVVRNRATGADRRADWAQKDEKDQKLAQQQQSNNGHSKVPRSPLLRKADSLWALKTKLVSSSKLHLNSNFSSGSGNKSRNSATSLETGTTTSPVKATSRGGFFARLRRLS
ncbi:uncharacterized protein PG986_009793 [Apiospora aurea]|uniref:Uncharacterized protein n=1 Tax=Apiospora aurea TaxID=335848 RepID=A0ABR1Q8P9_9PEZI